MAIKGGWFGSGNRGFVGGGGGAPPASPTTSGVHQKGAGRVATVADARRLVAPVPATARPVGTPSPSTRATPGNKQRESRANRVKATSESTETRSHLNRAPIIACLLTDGHSHEVHKLFMDRTHEFDEASGQRLQVIGIGDPELSGPNFRATRTPEELATAAADAAAYVEEVVQRGREAFHVVAVARDVATALQISHHALPCVVFVRASDRCTLGVFQIEPAWYRTPIAQRALGHVLEDCLRAFEPPANLDQLEMGALDPLLRNWKEDAELAVYRSTQPSGSKPDRAPESVILEIRPESGELRFKGVPADLRPTPLRVLVALAKRPDEFISADDLAAGASWRGGDSGFDSRRWLHDQASAIRKALVGTGQLTLSEALDLIEVRRGCCRLRLEGNKIL